MNCKINSLLLIVFIAFFASCENSVNIKNDAYIAVDNEATDYSEQNDTENNDEITTDEDTIGKECYANDKCASTEFCNKTAGTCDNFTAGTCEKRLENCEISSAIDAQCGCDDYTYSNLCWASAAGMVINFSGECPGDVMCKNSSYCGNDEYCQKKPGVCDLGLGVCRTKPDNNDCPPAEIVKPVCGCDLKNYEDICYAVISDVAVKYEGKCSGN
ncbi:MAG TPA: hypothetical protein PLZ43_13860 [bacterium]|nr:hypothetical protein [bacterium]